MKRKKILYVGLDPSHYEADGEVTHLPLIEIISTPIDHPDVQKAFKPFREYTHVIVTSKTAVQILAAYLPYFGYTHCDWEAKKVAAVGRVTASHLEQIGIRPWIVAKEETAEGILAEIDPEQHKNSHFFWPHSALSRPIISDFFTLQGIRLTECLLYQPCTRFPCEAIDPYAFDEIVFTSPSTVQAFLDVFKHFPENLQLTPIGPVTALHLKRLIQNKSPEDLPKPTRS